jgi:hypothetical protein
VVVVGQVRFEKTEHGERDRACFEERKDNRESAREPRGFDAAAGFVFAEAELFDAVTEERREAFSDMETASIHFAQMFDDCRDRAPMGGDEDVELPEKRVVRKIGEADRCSLK